MDRNPREEWEDLLLGRDTAPRTLEALQKLAKDAAFYDVCAICSEHATMKIGRGASNVSPLVYCNCVPRLPLRVGDKEGFLKPSFAHLSCVNKKESSRLREGQFKYDVHASFCRICNEEVRFSSLPLWLQ